MKDLLIEFKKICFQLNKIGIIPTLMGSLGLGYRSMKDWQPSDIDIHVPGDPRGWNVPDELRINDFEKIRNIMEGSGYELADLHEHEFHKNGIIVEYGSIDSLYDFAGISVSEIELVRLEDIHFRVPDLKQFLSIYCASAKDSYRNDQNNNKDFEKIDWLVRHIDDFVFVSLRELPGWIDAAAGWFCDKWSVSRSAYYECMNDYLEKKTEYGWYLCIFKGNIVGGLGVIENDFHNRKDLSPNICAVYTQEGYRGRGIAGKLLDTAVSDLKNKGISPVYLLTDHIGFYERYGWKFLCLVQGDDEEKMSRMYVHS